MNDADLEKNLRYLLRPTEPTPGLRRRIEQDLSTDATPLPAPAPANRFTPSPTPGFLYRLLRDFGWACAGAAAVLAVLTLPPGKHLPTPDPDQSLIANDPATATIQTTAFEHDETTHELVSAENSDQLVDTDDGPAREIRYSYVERHAWSNPLTGASVILEVPREDVYLLPVSLE